MNYENILTSNDKGNLEKLNKECNYVFSKTSLLKMIRKYRKANIENDFKTMAAIDYRLTDSNFHTLCSLLSIGEYTKANKHINNEYAAMDLPF